MGDLRLLAARTEAVLDWGEISAARNEGEAETLACARAEELMTRVPGIDVWSTQVIVAEIGADLSQLPGFGHLASWAGVRPGNSERAGKRRTGEDNARQPMASRHGAQAAPAHPVLATIYHTPQHRRLNKDRLVHDPLKGLASPGHHVLIASIERAA